jgi:putative FmdB family regulatory protein
LSDSKYPQQKAQISGGLVSLNCALFNADFPSVVSASDRLHTFMPTYEYACQKCGQNFEAFQSMRAEPFQECPKELCRLPDWGHGKVKRLLGTGAGLIFKGSGFYITDYRSDSYKEAAKKESPATEKAGEKASSPKETAAKSPSPTPAAKPEKKPGKASAE